MSIAEFFNKVRSAVANAMHPKASQHDLAVKATAMVAEGAHRQLHGPRRPKRNLHVGQITQIGESEHRLPSRNGVRRTIKVPVFYQLMVDGSRYPFAHNDGGRHPGWLTKGSR